MGGSADRSTTAGDITWNGLGCVRAHARALGGYVPGSTFGEVYRFLLKAEDVITFALDNQDESISAIDWAFFFDRLYVPRNDEEEEELKNVFADANRIALVVAPRGGGKTTFLLNRLLKYREAGGAYYFFDFTKNTDAFEEIAQDWPRRIHQIQAILKTDLYNSYVGDDRRKNNRFIAQALEMFYPHEKVRLGLRLSSNTDIDLETESLLSVLQERPDIALELDSFVHAKLSFGEMVQVLMKLNEWRQFVVCFDNVDRLKADFQPYLLSLAIDVYHRGRGVFGTVVTLREKNVLRYSENGADGDVIDIITPTGVPERANRLDLTPPEDAFVKKLLTARQEYARDEYILQSLGRLDSEFKAIYAATVDHANMSFINQHLYNLANHSWRIMLVLSCGFTRYLVRLVYSGTVEFANSQLKLSETDRRSYFYRWCYASTNPKHEWLRDPIDNYRRYARGMIQLASDCDLEWVVLAWLQNHISKLRVLDVMKAFEKFGVASPRVRAAIYALYDCESVSRRYVELGDRETKLSQEDIKPGTLLYITPLGIEFIRNTVTKFEFMLQAIRHPDAQAEDSEAMLRPLDHKSEFAVRLVYDHLRSMAVAHAAALKEFRSGLANESSWEKVYRADFCIGAHLTIERIAVSHMAHLRQVGEPIAEYAKKLYHRLLEEYYRLAEIDRDPNHIIG